MPTILSLPGRNTVGNFYSKIHSAQKQLFDSGAIPPSVKEVDDWLIKNYGNNPPQHVLDAGCGLNAFNSLLCARHGFSVAAIDINPDANQAFPIEYKDKIRFQYGSVLSIPFKSNSFDLSFCTGVAHHTPDPDKVFEELFRVTKPGGRLYISLYCFDKSLFLYSVRLLRLIGRIIPFSLMNRYFSGYPAINNFIMDHMYTPILWVYTKEEAEASLTKAGLVVESSSNSQIDLFYKKRPFGISITGDGLYRTFICRKPL